MGLVGAVALVVGTVALFGLLVWAEAEEEAARNEHAAHLAWLDERLEATRRAHPDLPVMRPRSPARRRGSRTSRVLAGVPRGPSKWTG